MKTGPKYKIARRLGERVFPKTQTAKFVISGTEKKMGRRKTLSDYGRQLLEKQKAKYTYGVSEKQFVGYVNKARGAKGNPAEALYTLLEKRLDNVAFRLGLFRSRAFARQGVAHGHILVNGRKVTIPSYQVRGGDVISIRTGSQQNGIFREIATKLAEHTAPSWLLFNLDEKRGEVKAEPLMSEGEMNLNFSTILEFYSRV